MLFYAHCKFNLFLKDSSFSENVGGFIDEYFIDNRSPTSSIISKACNWFNRRIHC